VRYINYKYLVYVKKKGILKTKGILSIKHNFLNFDDLLFRMPTYKLYLKF